MPFVKCMFQRTTLVPEIKKNDYKHTSIHTDGQRTFEQLES